MTDLPKGAVEAALSAFKSCRPVERVACQDFGMQQDDILQQQLESAITAYHAALEAEGFVVVPGDLARKVTSIARRNEDAPEIHELSAMLAAAQEQNDA